MNIDNPPKIRKWVFLSEESKKLLGNLYPGIFKVKLLNHITLESPLIDNNNIGLNIDLFVDGYTSDDELEVLAVKLPDNIYCQNKIPHITVSVKSGINPKKANDLLLKGYKAIEPILITGRIDIQENGWSSKQ